MPNPSIAEAAKRVRERLDEASERLRKEFQERARIEAQVRVKRLDPRAVLPKRANEHAAGMDLCAIEPHVLQPGERKLIKTGLAMAIPPGFEGQVRPRSGLALKHGVTVLNAPGTIDSDYRGEVGALLVNHGDKAFVIERGDRIAQLVVARYSKLSEVVEVEDLDKTDRGEGGFGSTGR